jgi:hypothetical protein
MLYPLSYGRVFSSTPAPTFLPEPHAPVYPFGREGQAGCDSSRRLTPIL